MKNITLLLVTFIFTFTSNAQQILQQEGFADTTIPAGWVTNNLTSACDWQFGYTGEMPDSGTPAATFPSGAAMFDDATCGTLSSDITALTSPAIDISNISNAQIEVIYNIQVFATKGIFKIEVFDGGSWQQVFFQDEDSPRNTGANQTAIVDVSSYINNAFQVRFVYDDEGYLAWGLAIDDYKLSDTSVAGVEDLAALGYNYYPNPVGKILKFNAKNNIDQISVYNIVGQSVMSEFPTDSNVELDMTTLPIGAYFVKVQTDNKISSFKILKQ